MDASHLITGDAGHSVLSVGPCKAGATDVNAQCVSASTRHLNAPERRLRDLAPGKVAHFSLRAALMAR